MLGFEDELPKTDEYSHALIRFLQHGNALGEAILECMPHPIIIFNENLKIVRANLSAKKLYQKRSDEFNGFLLQDIDAQFSGLKIAALNEQKSGSLHVLGEWKTKILFRMDNRSYYILFK